MKVKNRARRISLLNALIDGVLRNLPLAEDPEEELAYELAIPFMNRYWNRYHKEAAQVGVISTWRRMAQ